MCSNSSEHSDQPFPFFIKRFSKKSQACLSMSMTKKRGSILVAKEEGLSSQHHNTSGCRRDGDGEPEAVFGKQVHHGGEQEAEGEGPCTWQGEQRIAMPPEPTNPVN
ncbi:hypothetical protein DsansV1_C31g0219591 [Dioscorea sansibarensis]